jgi:hypothetical protein
MFVVFNRFMFALCSMIVIAMAYWLNDITDGGLVNMLRMIILAVIRE